MISATASFPSASLRSRRGFTAADSMGCGGDSTCFGAGLRRSVYVECTFNGSRVEASYPGIVRFERCSFRDVHLRRWICTRVEFVDCIFTGRAEGVAWSWSTRDFKAAST